MGFSWKPPWSGIEPGGWSDGDGFVSPSVKEGLAFSVIRGAAIIPAGQDRVIVLFAAPLPLGTEYEVVANVQNVAAGDPAEYIFPTQIISKNNDGVKEIGFTYGLNSAPVASTAQFRWQVFYYA